MLMRDEMTTGSREMKKMRKKTKKIFGWIPAEDERNVPVQ
jgi:hypothetical protein